MAYEEEVRLGGRLLKCYRLATLGEPVCNTMQLDTTGQYLRLNRKPVVLPEKESELEVQENLFAYNVFHFLENAERILGDSRMFLSPVPIQNALAYTGTSGFTRPTLGVYLEWWLRFGDTEQIDADGRKWRVLRLSGSPLSGCNCCTLVDERGETTYRSVDGFGNLWQRFVRINTQCDEAKALYEAYPLSEVVRILKDEGADVVDEAQVRLANLQGDLDRTGRRLEEAETDAADWKKRYKWLLYSTKKEEVMAYLAQCCEQRKVRDKELARLKAERAELMQRMRHGLTDFVEYQREDARLKHAMDDLRQEWNTLVNMRPRQMFPGEKVTKPDLEEWARAQAERDEYKRNKNKKKGDE